MQAQRRHRHPSFQDDAPAHDVRGGLWHEPGTQVDRAPPHHSPARDHEPQRSSPPSPRARPDRKPASRSASRPILWGFLGFALGIAFWHVIGFWGFVASVVLPQSSDRESLSQSQRLVDPRDATPNPSKTVSHARPTRTLQQQQVLAGKTAAATAPPLTNEPQREMPLPGWGTTVVTAGSETSE